MNHFADIEDTNALIVDYVLGDLGPAEARAFGQRLVVEPELAREVERVRTALGLVPYARVTEPPPALRGRILEAAATAHTKPAARRTIRPAWQTLATAAAVLLAIFLGVDGYRVRRELRLQHDVSALLQEPNVVMSFAMRGTGAGAGAIGRVALDLDAGRGAAAIEGLPALAEGQVYRLWALVGDKNVPCGEFKVDPRGTVGAQFRIPVDAYTAPIAKLFLTVEPATAPLRPSGPVLMSS